jgi:glyoxylase-like metal-dependent hydrolase (beta-lactamase superfamily II)
MVDTGIPTALAKQAFYYWKGQRIPQKVRDLSDQRSESELTGGLRAVGYSLEDVGLLLISHGHLDHFSMGQMIVEKSKARVIAHLLDTAEICNPWSMPKGWVMNRPRFSAMGVPLPQAQFSSSWDMSDFSLKVDQPIFKEGWLSLDNYQSKFIFIRHTPGHSPGGISLLIGEGDDKEKVLLCGDVLLQPITPHPDDLVSYLNTLEGLGKLEDVALVLPGHGNNIRDLRQRVAFLKRHHRRRLYLTYQACRRPRSVWEIATLPHYFDILVNPQEFNPLAATEAMVHVKLLKQAGGVHLSHIARGVYYFQSTGESFDQIYERAMEIVNQPQSFNPLDS